MREIGYFWGIFFVHAPTLGFNEKMFSHAPIRPQGAEKWLRKVNWMVGCSQTPIVHKTIMQYAPLILSYHHVWVNTIQNLIQKCEVIFWNWDSPTRLLYFMTEILFSDILLWVALISIAILRLYITQCHLQHLRAWKEGNIIIYNYLLSGKKYFDQRKLIVTKKVSKKWIKF